MPSHTKGAQNPGDKRLTRDVCQTTGPILYPKPASDILEHKLSVIDFFLSEGN